MVYKNHKNHKNHKNQNLEAWERLFYVESADISEFILNPGLSMEDIEYGFGLWVPFYESMELNLFWIPGSPI